MLEVIRLEGAGMKRIRKCDNCGENEPREENCPYSEELYSELKQETCFCCDDCRYQCMMNI